MRPRLDNKIIYMSHSVLAHFLTNGHAELLHGAAVGLQAIEEGAASLLE